MQVGGHGIRNKSLLLGRNRVAKPETASPVPHVKDHTARTGFCQSGIYLAVSKNDGKLLSKHVGVNITGTHFLQKIFVRSL